MRHTITLILIAVLAGCAASSGKSPSAQSEDPKKDITISGGDSDVQFTGTKIDKSDLEGATPVAVLSKAEFVELIRREAGLPEFNQDKECDEAVVELKDLGFEVATVTESRVDVSLPAQRMTYQYIFEDKPCSKKYQTP